MVCTVVVSKRFSWWTCDALECFDSGMVVQFTFVVEVRQCRPVILLMMEHQMMKCCEVYIEPHDDVPHHLHIAAGKVRRESVSSTDWRKIKKTRNIKEKG